MDKINYSVVEKGFEGVKVVTSRLEDGKSVEILNEVRAYWDVNHQILLEIQEKDTSRIIKTSLSKGKADYTPQSSFCEISIDVLCKTGGSIVCQAACLALREIPVIGVIFDATACAGVCVSIVNEGCNGAKAKLCEG